MDVEAIKALIHEAFQGLKRDEDCTLHQAQLDDDSASRRISRQEWTAAKLWDPETDWRDVPASALEECNSALSHISPQSWHFYLPAYMERALELIDTWGRTPPEQRPCGVEDLPFSVVQHLTYRDERGLGPAHLLNFHRLNEAQESAVVAFLEFVRDSLSFVADDAAVALRKYWAVPPDRRPGLHADQWRIDNARHLSGLTLHRRLYSWRSEAWGPDHCAACWVRFTENGDETESVHAGYTTGSDYPQGADHEWVCLTCFADLADELGWKPVA